MKTPWGRTVANIFTLFFPQHSQISGLPGGKQILQKLHCLLKFTHVTDGQTDRRKSDLNSTAHYVTLSKTTK